MFTVYQKAEMLPREWDKIVTENPFMSRETLKQLEGLNPCQQTYHFSQDFNTALVSYRLKLNLFTFTRGLTLKIPLNIIGVPLSVSSPGLIYDERYREELIQYLRTLKGPHIILNAKDGLKLPKGITLPSFQLKVEWKTMEEYYNSLRSHYRYRCKKAAGKLGEIKIEELAEQQSFNEEMYQLYLEVFENSNEKLEKLSIDFFKYFPAKIITFTLKKEIVAFIQLMEKGEELVFLFGGFKHSLNLHYDLYMNLLLTIIDYGIKGGFKSIELGQTAEETKLKLGARGQVKYLYAFHHNPMVNKLIQRWIPSLSYQAYDIEHHVFKGE